MAPQRDDEGFWRRLRRSRFIEIVTGVGAPASPPPAEGMDGGECYRALDVVDGWQGPRRDTIAEAQRDVERRDASVAGRGRQVAIVVRRQGDRCVHLDGGPVRCARDRGGICRWQR